MPARPPRSFRAPLLAPLALAAACSAPTRPAVVAPPASSAARSAPAADAAAAAAVPAPLANGRLPDFARPLRYALELDVDPAADRYSGTQRIELSIPRPTRFIVLHARGLHVASAMLTAPAFPLVAAHTVPRASAGGRGEPEELVLVFDREIPTGNASLTLLFDGAFGRASPGLFHVEYEGARYAFTDFEPTDARRAFPCFDEPGFKVPWQLTLRVPSGLRAFANMPEASRSEDAPARRTVVRFAPTPPTSSYLVSFAVGPFDTLDGGGDPLPVRVITPRGKSALARTALEAAQAHVRLLAQYFDRAFPYPKLDLVAIPGFSGAMENPGLVTFGDEFLLLDPTHPSTEARREMAVTVAHELSHQWFGDLVTMAWWDDLWLNEGFATWMESRVVDQWQPAFGARAEALSGRAYAMNLDALPGTRAVRQPVESTSEALAAFDAITYQKGAAVLSMLEAWVGEEAFRNGVRSYIRSHEWSTATARDLFAALQQTSGRDVASVAGSFLDRAGVPLVTAEVRCEPGAQPVLALRQERTVLVGTGTAHAGEPPWRVPVCVQFEAQGGPRRTCALLTDAQATAPLEGATRCPRWLYPNADEAGYYHYALPPVVRALATPATLRTLDLRARVGFVDNAWALVRAGSLGVDELLRLLQGFRGERDRLVVERVADVARDVDDALSDDATRGPLHAWIARFFAPIAREVGWDSRANEGDDRRLVRAVVLRTLGARGDDAATLAEAERRTQAYLREPGLVDPDLAAVALPLASRRADASRVDALMARLRGAPTPAARAVVVDALGGFEDPTALRRALDLALTDAVRPQEALELLHSAFGARARRVVALAWLHANWDALRARLPPLGVASVPQLALRGACTDAELEQERAFWQPRLANVDGGDEALATGAARGAQCAALRQNEAARLRRFFGR